MHTTSIHKFYRYINRQTMCACMWLTVHTSLLFLRLLSEIFLMSTNAWFVFSLLYWRLNKGHKVTLDLVVEAFIDLTTFWTISNTYPGADLGFAEGRG